MKEKMYTTSEAAAKVGVSYQTLNNWLTRPFFPTPKLVNVGKNPSYFWTECEFVLWIEPVLIAVVTETQFAVSG